MDWHMVFWLPAGICVKISNFYFFLELYVTCFSVAEQIFGLSHWLMDNMAHGHKKTPERPKARPPRNTHKFLPRVQVQI